METARQDPSAVCGLSASPSWEDASRQPSDRPLQREPKMFTGCPQRRRRVFDHPGRSMRSASEVAAKLVLHKSELLGVAQKDTCLLRRGEEASLRCFSSRFLSDIVLSIQLLCMYMRAIHEGTIRTRSPHQMRLSRSRQARPCKQEEEKPLRATCACLGLEEVPSLTSRLPHAKLVVSTVPNDSKSTSGHPSTQPTLR